MNVKYIEEIRINRAFEPNEYPFCLTAVKSVINGGLKLDSPVTIFTGENGTGKSTLIEAIACAAGFNPEGGSKNFSFETNNTVSVLSEYITLSRGAYPKDGFFLRAESFYNAATYIDEVQVTGYGDISLHEMSHGESFLTLVKNRFRGNGLYILDEPEAALSPLRQMNLLAEMNRLCNANSQIILATHSPILLAFPGAQILEIRDDGIYRTEYDKCRNVRIYRDFLARTRENVELIMLEALDDTV